MIRTYQLVRMITDLRKPESNTELPDFLGSFYSAAEAMAALPSDIPDADNRKVLTLFYIIDMDTPPPYIVATYEAGGLSSGRGWLLTRRFRGDRTGLPTGSYSPSLEAYLNLAEMIEAAIPDPQAQQKTIRALEEYAQLEDRRYWELKVGEIGIRRNPAPLDEASGNSPERNN